MLACNDWRTTLATHQAMSSIKLILLNIGWVALALGAYFLGKSDGEDASPVVGSTSKFDRTLFALREEGYPGRTPGKDDSSTNNLQAGAASVTQALRDAEAAQVREEERIADFFARTATAENALSMLEEFKKTPRNEISDALFREFLLAWGKVAGPEAVSLVVNSTWTEPYALRWGTKESVESVTAGWASVDPAAAIAFTATLRDNTEFRGSTYKSTEMQLGILQALQRSDLDRAIAYSQQFYTETLKFWKKEHIDSFPNGEDLRGLESVAAAVMEQRGLSGLEAWVSGLGGETPGMLKYKAKASTRMLKEVAKAEEMKITRP